MLKRKISRLSTKKVPEKTKIELNVLVMEEVEFKSEKPPRYFRKGGVNLKPYLRDFDRRRQLKLIFDDNSPTRK